MSNTTQATYDRGYQMVMAEDAFLRGYHDAIAALDAAKGKGGVHPGDDRSPAQRALRTQPAARKNAMPKPREEVMAQAARAALDKSMKAAAARAVADQSRVKPGRNPADTRTVKRPTSHLTIASSLGDCMKQLSAAISGGRR